MISHRPRASIPRNNPRWSIFRNFSNWKLVCHVFENFLWMCQNKLRTIAPHSRAYSLFVQTYPRHMVPRQITVQQRTGYPTWFSISLDSCYGYPKDIAYTNFILRCTSMSWLSILDLTFIDHLYTIFLMRTQV